ncbi:hypothetical protein CPB84DRAFT_1849837 [Gymnopilus junonius]|uniref:SUN domain-containing protein n=1 Tax=Gymnopilus junonius TaxID=109634 RepID=A0A9P5TKW7_GYMJU|nr:hypothetical protein CPB84DRAFT_1849837 [Gymnopilus junonius]
MPNESQTPEFPGESFILPGAIDIGPAPWTVQKNSVPSATSLYQTVVAPAESPTVLSWHKTPIDRSGCPSHSLWMFLSATTVAVSTIALMASSCLWPGASPVVLLCEADHIVFAGILQRFCSVAHFADLLSDDTFCRKGLTWTSRVGWFGMAIARCNYTSEGAGTTVITEFRSTTHGLIENCSPKWWDSSSEIACWMKNVELNSAAVVLDENMQAGECWEFLGTSGHVALNLSEPIMISHLVIDHASPLALSKAATRRSPRNMSLWVFVDSSHAENKLAGAKFFPISHFMGRTIPLDELFTPERRHLPPQWGALSNPPSAKPLSATPSLFVLNSQQALWAPSGHINLSHPGSMAENLGHFFQGH